MTAYVVLPATLTATTGTGFSTVYPVTNVGLEAKGMVAKATGTSGTMTLSIASQLVDTIVVISNISNSSATVKCEITSASVNTTVNAFVGSKDPVFTTKTIIKLPTPVTASSVKLTFTGAQSGFEVQRVVIGKRIETEGIDYNADQSFEDLSVVEQFEGGEHIRPFDKRPVWKVKMSGISQAKWFSEMAPFFMKAGTSRYFFFVPVDDATRIQHEACYGRISVVSKGEVVGYDTWTAQFTVTGLTA